MKWLRISARIFRVWAVRISRTNQKLTWRDEKKFQNLCKRRLTNTLISSWKQWACHMIKGLWFWIAQKLPLWCQCALKWEEADSKRMKEKSRGQLRSRHRTAINQVFICGLNSWLFSLKGDSTGGKPYLVEKPFLIDKNKNAGNEMEEKCCYVMSEKWDTRSDYNCTANTERSAHRLRLAETPTQADTK